MTTTTEHYTVLARRYRPQTFDDIVGQSHVSQALQNAIRKNRVAHAYLFTGARGVGKTSMARILAKALNCAAGEDGIPCHQCDICLGIAAGNDVDVLEIDGASNRGIDDIRALRANVNIKSMRTEYKIYIIDEVHMLTKEAFNALLKTLEEPPPKVKFVFCTTEPNKVPDTILSRCQRFDFASVDTTNIAKRLTEIAQSEGVQVAGDAIDLIARRAAGSMRDSQSLFDQLLAFGGDEISAEDVHRLMGTAADDLLSNMVQAMIDSDQNQLLSILDQALSQGVRLGEMVDQLINYFRDMMIVGAKADDVGLLGVSNEHRPKLKQQAERWGIDRTIAAMQIVAETRTKMQRVTSGRSLAELALIRVSLLENLSQLGPLITAMKTGRPLPVVEVTAPLTAIAAPVDVTVTPEVSTPAEVNPPNSPEVATPIESETQKKTIEIENVPVQPEIPVESPLPEVEFCEENRSLLLTKLVESSEDKVKHHLKGISSTAISAPNALDLIFNSSYSFSRSCCDEPDVKRNLEETLRNLTGQPIQIQLLIEASTETKKVATPTPQEAIKRNPTEHCDDPFVKQAQSIFDAKIIDVRPVPPPRMELNHDN